MTIIIEYQITTIIKKENLIEIDADEIPNQQGTLRTSAVRFRFSPTANQNSQSSQDYARALLFNLNDIITLSSTP